MKANETDRRHAGIEGGLYRGMSNYIRTDFCEVARPWRLAMESIDLQSMPLDELWALHETICLILARKARSGKTLTRTAT